MKSIIFEKNKPNIFVHQNPLIDLYLSIHGHYRFYHNYFLGLNKN